MTTGQPNTSSGQPFGPSTARRIFIHRDNFAWELATQSIVPAREYGVLKKCDPTRFHHQALPLFIAHCVDNGVAVEFPARRWE